MQEPAINGAHVCLTSVTRLGDGQSAVQSMRLGFAKLSFERYQRGSKWPAGPGGVQGSWLELVFGFLMEADGRLSQKKVLESDEARRNPADSPPPGVCAKQAFVVMVTEEVDRERRLLKFGDDRSHSWRSGHPLDHVQGRGGNGSEGSAGGV